MAIFSRRSLQRLLREDVSLVSTKQTKEFATKLNRGELAAEWEIVLLNALSKHGSVAYEKNFGGRREADIFFETDNPRGNFLAEVTAVSDKGLDALNPIDDLLAEFRQIVHDNGFNPADFSLRIGDGDEKHYKGGPKTRLKLPAKSRFRSAVFGTAFQEFMGGLKRNPKAGSRILIKNQEVDAAIEYLPNRFHFSASWPSYKVIYSLTENRIYGALEEKAQQLENTNFSGPLAVFLCDGGCGFLAGETIGNISYAPREVIFGFLHEHASISFVVTFVVRRENSFAFSRFDENPYRVFSNLYRGTNYRSMSIDIEGLMGRLRYPQAHLDAQTALNHVKIYTHSGKYHGGSMTYKMDSSETTIRISARSLLELLAGQITQEDFFRRHDFLKEENRFCRALLSGKMLVELETSPEDDDDWVIFKLGGPDPAISKFIVPDRKTGESKS